MAFVVKGFKTVRNNWKKTVFFTGAAAYGINWLRIIYEDGALRTSYCIRAREFGDCPLGLSERPRRVLVFLNPVTQNGTAKKLFDKNIAPILHCAGLEVTLVKTEYEGQAKKYMDAVEDTDAIIVAGGDGTLSEVVTGLLRRKDQDKVSKIPIGIVPMGRTNSLADRLFMRSKDSNVRWWLEASMAVVENRTKAIDVMRIKGDNEKPVYALAGVNWGIFRDTEAKSRKYWYFGPLKRRWAYLWNSLKFRWSPTFKANFSFQRPCEGCAKCYAPPPPPIWRWWHTLIPPKAHVPDKDYSVIDNPLCGQEHCMELTTTEFSCRTPILQATSQQEHSGISITFLPDSLNRMQFIKEGFARIKGEHIPELTGETVCAGSFSLVPETKEGTESWFTIDSEQFEVMPIEVELLRNKITMFCGGDTPFVA